MPSFLLGPAPRRRKAALRMLMLMLLLAVRHVCRCRTAVLAPSFLPGPAPRRRKAELLMLMLMLLPFRHDRRCRTAVLVRYVLLPFDTAANSDSKSTTPSGRLLPHSMRFFSTSVPPCSPDRRRRTGVLPLPSIQGGCWRTIFLRFEPSSHHRIRRRRDVCLAAAAVTQRDFCHMF